MHPSAKAAEASKCVCGFSEAYCKYSKRSCHDWGSLPPDSKPGSFDLRRLYKDWCYETKRNGGVLIGKSIHEFLDYAQAAWDAAIKSNNNAKV